MSVIEGVKDYHNTVLAEVEINNCKLARPPRVQVNRNNISTMQLALLETYQNGTETGNPYAAVKGYNGKYFSLMHDGIQKFGMELNGVFVRVASYSSDVNESVEVLNVPWGLKKIEGGSLNAEKLVFHLINIMNIIRPIKNSAFQEVRGQLDLITKENKDFIAPDSPPPDFFKSCTLVSMNATKIEL